MLTRWIWIKIQKNVADDEASKFNTHLANIDTILKKHVLSVQTQQNKRTNLFLTLHRISSKLMIIQWKIIFSIISRNTFFKLFVYHDCII